MVLFSLARPAMGTKAVDLGSGYGSGARYLALNFGATVDCVDLSQDANDQNRSLTEKAGLSHLVKVRCVAGERAGSSTTVYCTMPTSIFLTWGGGGGGDYRRRTIMDEIS